ncbi:MAG: phage tail terminator family protein [Thermovenabulum sp.]|uniref:phage tail terminator family protein n=1 Tax=Thermovenabulum sp. TaxID=3100335 RepID=UPI003C7B8793
MLTFWDIKKAVAERIKTKFNYPIYVNDVTEGFSKPSFFVRIFPITSEIANANTTHNKVTVEINYFQAQKSEQDNLQTMQVLKELFLQPLAVLDRKLICEDLRVEVAEEEKQIYQFLFDLDYYDELPKTTESYELMGEILINEEVEQ